MNEKMRRKDRETTEERAYEILKNGYMNGSIVDIHGGYDYF